MWLMPIWLATSDFGPKFKPVRVTASDPAVASDVRAAVLILLSVGAAYEVVTGVPMLWEAVEDWPPTSTCHECPLPVPGGVGHRITVCELTVHVMVMVSPDSALSRHFAVTVFWTFTGPKLVPVMVSMWLPSVGMPDLDGGSKSVMMG